MEFLVSGREYNILKKCKAFVEDIQWCRQHNKWYENYPLRKRHIDQHYFKRNKSCEYCEDIYFIERNSRSKILLSYEKLDKYCKNLDVINLLFSDNETIELKKRLDSIRKQPLLRMKYFLNKSSTLLWNKFAAPLIEVYNDYNCKRKEVQTIKKNSQLMFG